MIVEAHVLDGDADPDNDVWTTLPDTGGLRTRRPGDSCAEGLASGSDAQHPWLLHYYNAGLRADGRDRHRHVERLHRQLRGLAGLDRRPHAVRGQAGRAVHHQRHRLGHAGARHLDRRREGDGRRRRGRLDRLRGRHRRLDGRRRRPRGRSSTTPTGPAPPSSSPRAASSGPRTRSTPGSAFEGMDEAARPEFMKRAAAVPRRDQGHPGCGQPRARPAGAGNPPGGPTGGRPRDREDQVEQAPAREPQAPGRASA